MKTAIGTLLSYFLLCLGFFPPKVLAGECPLLPTYDSQEFNKVLFLVGEWHDPAEDDVYKKLIALRSQKFPTVKHCLFLEGDFKTYRKTLQDFNSAPKGTPLKLGQSPNRFPTVEFAHDQGWKVFAVDDFLPGPMAIEQAKGNCPNFDWRINNRSEAEANIRCRNRAMSRRVVSLLKKAPLSDKEAECEDGIFINGRGHIYSIDNWVKNEFLTPKILIPLLRQNHLFLSVGDNGHLSGLVLRIFETDEILQFLRTPACKYAMKPDVHP